MSKKSDEWDEVAAIVHDHVNNYGVIQYGDYGEEDELLGKMDADDCMEHIRQYVKRYGNGVRGEAEELRDLLKISHFSGVAYMRRSGLRPVE